MLPRLKLSGNLLSFVPLFTSDECINAFFEHVNFDEQLSCLNTSIIWLEWLYYMQLQSLHNSQLHTVAVTDSKTKINEIFTL